LGARSRAIVAVGLNATELPHDATAGSPCSFETFQVRLFAEFADGLVIESKDDYLLWRFSVDSAWSATGSGTPRATQDDIVRAELREAFASGDALTRWEPLSRTCFDEGIDVEAEALEHFELVVHLFRLD
jgi:hypothetical protein